MNDTFKVYLKGTRVWLAEFDNGAEVVPRQAATVLTCDDMRAAWSTPGVAGISYVVQVDEPESTDDDLLRELTGDQIEGEI